MSKSAFARLARLWKEERATFYVECNFFGEPLTGW